MCNRPLETLCLEAVDSYSLGFLFEVAVFFYCFHGLATVCDDHLVVALEKVRTHWNLSEDVAGATLMALGSGAPEVVINCVVSLRALSPENEEDAAGQSLGVGVVIGSGWIAFLLIPGCCAMLGKQPLHVKRRPLLRDIAFYFIALFTLAVSGLDEKVSFRESLSLLVLYVVYVVVVVTAPHCRSMYREKYGRSNSITDTPLNDNSVREVQISDISSSSGAGSAHAICEAHACTVELSGDRTLMAADVGIADGAIPHTISAGSQEMEQGCIEANVDTSTSPSVTVCSCLVEAMVNFPRWSLEWAFSHTVPESEDRYGIAMAVSFLWVAWFSMVITAVTTRWVELSGLDAGFFGVTLVALGGQIPDAMMSVSAARAGEGSMAVANAIGSQNLNILVGLGGPWALVASFGGKVKLPATSTLLASAWLQVGNMVLFLTLTVGVTIALKRPKVLLSRGLGRILVALYALSVFVLFIWVFNETDPH